MGSFVFRKELKGVDAYTRHKKLLKSYASYPLSTNKGSKSTKTHNPEHTILRKHHKFILPIDDPANSADITWEQRLAKKYYDQLFKEYALCELSYYKQGKIALRWRTEDEVVLGKGQFICASTKCDQTSDLTSWEVNFGYLEDGIKKNELVKVRLCIDCSQKLNYRTQKRMIKKQEKDSKRKRRRQRRLGDNNNGDVDDDANDSDDTSNEEDDDGPTAKKKKTGERQRGEDKHNNQAPESIWSKDLDNNGDKTKDEEFEDYFADLLQ
ncbi:folate-sensitive fragile site protein Fra10Ac1-domain-containing protein [Absidia repens]|uniref:Folate-sensitive fragile site protein Fra10Ac1-domain-containing protein n=1 Tax=Absidia repens TaxID=90262 RepID=A0A1X2IAI2_9FUNG|nr:folate-sensitive fragile site protein Fra10Ac1-domain-containing protein [Absidia repens]